MPNFRAPGVTVKPQEHDSCSWCNSQASGSWCNSHTSLFHTHYLKGVIPKPAMFYAAFFTLQECKQSRYRNSILFLTELGLPGLLCDSTEQIAWKYMKMPVKTCTKNISLPVISLCSWQFVGFFFLFFQERSGNITMRKSSMPHHTSARANSHNTNSVLAKIPELDTNNKSKMIPERFQWARLLTPWCIHPQKTTPVFRQQEEEIRIKHLQSRGLF